MKQLCAGILVCAIITVGTMLMLIHNSTVLSQEQNLKLPSDPTTVSITDLSTNQLYILPINQKPIVKALST